MTQALYAPWPKNARRSWGWAAIGVVVVSYFISAAPFAILAAVAAVIEAAQGAAPDQAVIGGLSIWVLLPALLVQFALWAGLVWLWSWAFERRGAASLGLTGGTSGLVRYGAGLVAGIALFGFIILLAGVLMSGADTEPATGLSAADRLTSVSVLGAFAFIVGVFLVQGGAEEIIFRGWLMSTLAARWGVTAAIIVSSLFFMLFHAHVFISGLVFGLAALAGIGALGLVFALLSLVTRSVIEAVAAHGAFNAAAVVIPTAALIAQDPDLSVGDAVAEVFAIATGTAGADALAVGPQLLAQSLGGAIVCAGLVLVLFRRKAAPAWKEQGE